MNRVSPPFRDRPNLRWAALCAPPWVNWLLATLAVGGMGATVLLDLPVRSSAFAASDLKTLYAAAWCLRHGLDAYALPNLQAVFRAQGMPLPGTWYGHAPVYPPVTLALLAPLTLLPMAGACLLWTLLSLLLMILAVAALLRYAEEAYALPLGWRAAVAGLCAAGPLFAFALTVGNLSVAASALAILAFLRRDRGAPWRPAVLLALAILLKPHLPFWVLAALLVLPRRRGRYVGVLAAIWTVGLGASLSAVLAFNVRGASPGGQTATQTAAFFRMVHTETAPGGSMYPGSREALPVVAQIPSLDSLLGFWSQSPVLRGAEVLVLAILFAALFGATRQIRDEHQEALATAAWCAFGMLTTYHRAHDAVLLLLLAPALADRLRRHPRSPQPWAAAACYVALSVGPRLGSSAGPQFLPRNAEDFPLLRQAALAALGLFLVLLWSLRSRLPRAASEAEVSPPLEVLSTS